MVAIAVICCLLNNTQSKSPTQAFGQRRFHQALLFSTMGPWSRCQHGHRSAREETQRLLETLAMSSEEYDSDCDSVTETEGSGDEVEVVQPSSETVTTAPRSSKENDKFKPARNTRGRRLRAAAKERSRVWAHYTRYDEPIMGIVDG
ncbi:PREDICTED: uncharacterized protein LOC101305566 [Fragaria vesca subsp. vesca]|uniref:uncharacterized protein LOC101305566 n=1 Tax=Fragaria vesca subsp. vesca TaxID=101020 RepID=UPI0002C32F85|nr:PREDICTED: uncharacterized protein LOC101305566 [Fragaria vesca subsp. vesca]